MNNASLRNTSVEAAARPSPTDVSPSLAKSQTIGRNANAHRASLILSTIDFCTIIVVALVSKVFYVDALVGVATGDAYYFVVAVGLAFVAHLFFAKCDLYEPSRAVVGPVPYGKLISAVALSHLIVLGILYSIKMSDFLSRGWFLIWFVGNVVALLSVRTVARSWLRKRLDHGDYCTQVAIFGTADYIERLSEVLNGPASRVAATFVRAERVSIGDDRGLAELLRALETKRIDRVVIGVPKADTETLRYATRRLAAFSTEVLLCTDLIADAASLRGTQTIGNLRFDVVNTVPSWDHPRGLKGILDVSLALFALIALAPLFALIALAIKLDSPGPLFFRQRRFGQNGRIFRIYKFRTMTVAEDGDAVTQASRNDVRVTRVGKFLRRSSLDELPQCINVLIGDMSIVGPRPHAVAHDLAFERQHEMFALRRRMRPGITGWAQVNGLRGELKTREDLAKRLDADLYYVANWSIWLDIEIIVRTAFTLSRNAY